MLSAVRDVRCDTDVSAPRAGTSTAPGRTGGQIGRRRNRAGRDESASPMNAFRSSSRTRIDVLGAFRETRKDGGGCRSATVHPRRGQPHPRRVRVGRHSRHSFHRRDVGRCHGAPREGERAVQAGGAVLRDQDVQEGPQDGGCHPEEVPQPRRDALDEGPDPREHGGRGQARGGARMREAGLEERRREPRLLARLRPPAPHRSQLQGGDQVLPPGAQDRRGQHADPARPVVHADADEGDGRVHRHAERDPQAATGEPRELDVHRRRAALRRRPRQSFGDHGAVRRDCGRDGRRRAGRGPEDRQVRALRDVHVQGEDAGRRRPRRRRARVSADERGEDRRPRRMDGAGRGFASAIGGVADDDQRRGLGRRRLTRRAPVESRERVPPPGGPHAGQPRVARASGEEPRSGKRRRRVETPVRRISGGAPGGGVLRARAFGFPARRGFRRRPPRVRNLAPAQGRPVSVPRTRGSVRGRAQDAFDGEGFYRDGDVASRDAGVPWKFRD